MNNKIIDIEELRDTEHKILSFMIQSYNHIEEVSKQLNKEDFTFIVNNIIYQTIIVGKEILKKYNTITEVDNAIQNIANILEKNHNIKKSSTIKILSAIPSQNIKKDIEKIQNYSFEKVVAKSKNLNEIEIAFEDKNGITTFYFTNNRLIEAVTTNIFKLPMELCDNLSDTMGSISAMELNTDDIKATMSFYGSKENPDGIESIYIKKDLLSLKWFHNICTWADKYELNEDIFPRNRFNLEALKKLDISDKKIKELPKEINKLVSLEVLIVDNNQIDKFPLELFELQNLFILSFLHNQISVIPKEISNLKNLTMFGACYNNIKKLPDSFYRLTNLYFICLHGNQLTTISDNICNFKKLSSLTISNNKINILPNSISQLELLDSIEIENTQIDDISSLLRLSNLNKICCDDKFLDEIIKNIHNLPHIDSINLSESSYTHNDELLKNIILKEKTKKWMEEKDRLENGCIVLSMCTIDKDVLRTVDKYLESKDLEEYKINLGKFEMFKTIHGNITNSF